MYLINARLLIDKREFEVVFFDDERIVPYAILSHQWRKDEVLFKMVNERPGYDVLSRRQGFMKIFWCCRQALKDGLSFVWVDTCCIDKSSSAELQEAINSMYRWYSTARQCYAYLSDVLFERDDEDCIQTSQWFQRGWTLQELLAPRSVKFYDKSWTYIGDRISLANTISQVTSIPKVYLSKGLTHDDRPFASQVMSWAKGRKTTRIEDRAYSLLGLFGINMTMLYGEGRNAFRRLQQEIIRSSTDQSIFAWEHTEPGYPGCFARSPDDFAFDRAVEIPKHTDFRASRQSSHTIDNQGITITVQLIPWASYIYLAELNCEYVGPDGDLFKYGIFVRELDDRRFFGRVRYGGRMTLKYKHRYNSIGLEHPGSRVTQITIVQSISPIEKEYLDSSLRPYRFRVGFEANDVYTTSVEPFHAHWFRGDVNHITGEDIFGAVPGENGYVAVADIMPSQSGWRDHILVGIGIVNFVPYINVTSQFSDPFPKSYGVYEKFWNEVLTSKNWQSRSSSDKAEPMQDVVPSEINQQKIKVAHVHGWSALIGELSLSESQLMLRLYPTSPMSRANAQSLDMKIGITQDGASTFYFNIKASNWARNQRLGSNLDWSFHFHSASIVENG